MNAQSKSLAVNRFTSPVCVRTCITKVNNPIKLFVSDIEFAIARIIGASIVLTQAAPREASVRRFVVFVIFHETRDDPLTADLFQFCQGKERR